MINKLLGMQPNASEHGVHLDQMLEFMHWFMAVLFIGWSLFFVYVLFRFHQSRSPKADYHGAKTKITTHIEVSVIIIEAVLLIGFAFPLWARRVNQFPLEDSVKVRVVAQQFSFNFHYPGPDGKFGRRSFNLVSATNQVGVDRSDPAGKDDFVTNNDLHLPVNKAAILEITSKDVIHNVSIVAMRISQDANPGSEIPIWFTPVKTGMYEVICGQLCGLGHYGMRAMLTVETQQEFDDWQKQMLQLIPKDEPAAEAASSAPTPPVAPTDHGHGTGPGL